jgi:hypothetical protein
VVVVVLLLPVAVLLLPVVQHLLQLREVRLLL